MWHAAIRFTSAGERLLLTLCLLLSRFLLLYISCSTSRNCFVFVEFFWKRRHLSLNRVTLTHLYQLMYSKSQWTSALWCCKRSFLANYLQMPWFLFLFFLLLLAFPRLCQNKKHTKTENLFRTNLVRFVIPFAAMLEQRGTERVNLSS